MTRDRTFRALNAQSFKSNKLCVNNSLQVNYISSKSANNIAFNGPLCINDSLSVNSITPKSGSALNINGSLCVQEGRTLSVDRIKSKSGAPIQIDASLVLDPEVIFVNNIFPSTGSVVSVNASLCISASRNLAVDTITSKTPNGPITVNDSLCALVGIKTPDLLVTNMLNLTGTFPALDELQARTRYELYRLRYFSLQTKKAVALYPASKGAEDIEELLRTAWTEGTIEYNLNIAVGGAINLQEVRWFREWNGVVFGHELTSSGNIVPSGTSYIEDITGNLSQITFGGILNLNPQITAGTRFITEWFPDPTPRIQRWNSSTFLEDVGTPARVAVEIQQAGISNSLFFLQLFGDQAGNFVITEETSSESLAGAGNIAPVVSANGYFPRADANGSLFVPADNTIKVSAGHLVFSPEISLGNPPPSSDIYSLWRNLEADFNDNFFATMPSNVLSATNTADVSTLSGRPAIRRSVSGRQYNRPTSTDGIPYMNYCRVTSQDVGHGFFNQSTTPGHSIWYFWLPGDSLWVCGPDDGWNANVIYEGPSGSRSFIPPGDPSPMNHLYSRYDSGSTVPHAPVFVAGMSSPVIANLGAPFNFYTKLFGTLNGTSPEDIADPAANGSVCTLMVGRTSLNGSAIGQGGVYDSIHFVGLQGNLDSQFLTTRPYPSGIPTSVNANSNFGVLIPGPSAFTLATPSQTFTKNINDVSSVSPTMPRAFNYGTITFPSPVNLSGTIEALMPPAFYLVAAETYDVDLMNLQNLISSVTTELAFYVNTTLGAVIDTVISLGMVDELISQRVFRNETVSRARIDALGRAIESVASALSSFTEQNSSSFATQLFDAGNFRSTNDFLNFVSNNGPRLLSITSTIIGSIPAPGTSLISTALTFASPLTARNQGVYTGLQIQQIIFRHITRSLALIQDGDTNGALSEGIQGVMVFSELINNTSIDSSGNILTFDVGSINIGCDISSFIPANIASRLQPLDTNFTDRSIMLGSATDLIKIETAIQLILGLMASLETSLGLPPFDPDDLTGVIL